VTTPRNALQREGDDRDGSVLQRRQVGKITRGIFNLIGDALYPLLSGAQTDQDVIRAFEKTAPGDGREFMPALASLVLQVAHGGHFPKRREAQVNFLADSLAACGQASAGHSRDIWQRERLKEKTAHHIIR
jgi:hypothetical protein